jgi:hypothetical protein
MCCLHASSLGQPMSCARHRNTCTELGCDFGFEHVLRSTLCIVHCACRVWDRLGLIVESLDFAYLLCIWKHVCSIVLYVMILECCPGQADMGL